MNDACKDELVDLTPQAQLLDSVAPLRRPTSSALDDLRELTAPFDSAVSVTAASEPDIQMEAWGEKKPVVNYPSSPTSSSPVVRLPACSSAASKLSGTSPSKMVQYDADALKAIGAMCGNRLPPASSVQAMFLYEMQRQTEQERLFQGELFRLAKAEEQSDAQKTSIADIQQKLKAFERQLNSKDVTERLSTSKVRMDAQQAKINDQSLRINDQDTHLKNIEGRIGDITTENTRLERVIHGHSTSITTQSHSLEDVQGKIEELQTTDASRDAQLAAHSQRTHKLEQHDQHAVSIFQHQDANTRTAFENSEMVRVNIAASDARNLRNLLVTHATLSEQFKTLEYTHANLSGDLTALEDDFKTLNAIATTHTKELSVLTTSNDSLKALHTALNEDISVLYDERDMLINHLNAAVARINKLEGTVRALTGQATSPTLSNDTNGTNSPQMLPVRAPRGKTFDLAVPKGRPLMKYRKADGDKENGRPIRPFVPGKQWEENGGEDAAVSLMSSQWASWRID